MRTKPSYLIVNMERGSIVRTTRIWPTLNPGEIAVRVALVIDDNIRPVHVVEVTDPETMLEAVTVPADPPEEE